MKTTLFSSLFIGLFLFFTGFLPHETVTAFLIRKNSIEKKKDTIKTFITKAVDNQKIDLLFCIKNFNYPPNLPKHIQLQTTASPFGTLNQKSIYDERGRIIKYYYHGSMVSGITPYGYDFIYENDSSFTIQYLKDENNKSLYQLFHDKKKNIEKIECSDTSGIIEKIILRY